MKYELKREELRIRPKREILEERKRDRKERRRRRVEKRSGNALEGWRGTKWVETQDFRSRGENMREIHTTFSDKNFTCLCDIHFEINGEME